MATFYGQVKGSGQTTATRQGSKASGIKASLQSYDGSITHVLTECNGDLFIEADLREGSGMGGRMVFYGTLEEYVEKLSGKTIADILS